MEHFAGERETQFNKNVEIGRPRILVEESLQITIRNSVTLILLSLGAAKLPLLHFEFLTSNS